MQTTSLAFRRMAAGHVRRITWQFRAAFEKEFDPSVTLFELNTSVLDGADVLGSGDSDVITEWNKYIYTDYTPRIIGMEWSSELNYLSSITASMADITLNNYDDFFTRDSGSPLNDYLLPRRPLKLFAGFNNENLPQFVGLSEKAPEVDRTGRTASLHAQDFLTFLFTKKLDQVVMYQDMRVDEILIELFALFGVLPDQMRLEKARTTVPYAFFDKDRSLGSVVQDLMKAEMGSLYMDEEGFIVFQNRLRQKSSPVMTLDGSNIIDYEVSDESQIINRVNVKSEVREVQPLQVIYSSVQPLLVPAGSSASFFFQFEDPVTTIDTIDGYVANTSQSGDGDDVTGLVTVTDTDLFSNSVKVTFANAGTEDAYITTLNIIGNPARVTRVVNIIQKDQDSIDQFEEMAFDVESPYIQDEDAATSIAITLIHHFKDYGSRLVLTVKGSPALQINDVVRVIIDGIDNEFIVLKTENNTLDNKFGQRLTVQKYEIPTYFTLDVSTLNSTDELAA